MIKRELLIQYFTDICEVFCVYFGVKYIISCFYDYILCISYISSTHITIILCGKVCLIDSIYQLINTAFQLVKTYHMVGRYFAILHGKKIA